MTRPLRAQDSDAIRREEEAARAAFPEAPRGSWVSDEGWLIIGDEAWTLQEWLGIPGDRYRHENRRRDPSKTREYTRRWRQEHAEEYRRLSRDDMRRRRRVA